MDYKVRLGQVIAEVRVASGLTQAELARSIDRGEATLSRWEGGKTMPSALDIRVLCEHFKVPADLFIFPPEEPVSPVRAALGQAVAEGFRQEIGRGRRTVRRPHVSRPRPRA